MNVMNVVHVMNVINVMNAMNVINVMHVMNVMNAMQKPISLGMSLSFHNHPMMGHFYKRHLTIGHSIFGASHVEASR